jgi:hypothetical protein
MNRFPKNPASPRRFVLVGTLATLLSIAVPAPAQQTVRPFPPKAERGAMVITQPPEMMLNGKPERLSPGSRIHAANNMLVMSGALVGQNLLVNYVREPLGLIHEVWILNAAEAKTPLPTGGLTLVQ